MAQLLYVDLVLLYPVDLRLLGLPFCLERLLRVAQVGDVLVELFELILIALALDGLTLDFELLDLARRIVESLRHGVHLEAELGGRLIDEVDGLVGEETVGDVAHRQLHGGDDRLVLDAHLVVVLIALLEAAEYGDR